MNRANQEALFQATNQGLLSIRQSEINYYQSLNVAFGTQAALIGGFTYGVFSQNQINYSNNYENVDVLADVYWVCSAITIALSVHVILCTMLMQVLGPGLALNGPVGSMARATEGMRLEQKPIIAAFIAMMVMFSISTVLSCWVVMSFEASIGCSIAFAIASGYWYIYCERIYLRFYWENEEAGWNARANSFDAMNEAEPIVPAAYVNKVSDIAKQKAHQKERKRRGILSSLFRSRKKAAAEDNAQDFRVSTDGQLEDLSHGSGGSSADAAGAGTGTGTGFAPHPLQRTMTNTSVLSDFGAGGLAVNRTWAATSASRGVVMEGYLTTRGGGGGKLMDFRTEQWERRYFTLTSTSCLFIYKTRQDYRTDPKSPIYTRPLRLYEYYIEINNHDVDELATNAGSVVEGATHRALFALNNVTVPDDSTIKPNRFQMTLVLRENADEVPNRVTEVNVNGVSNPLHSDEQRAQRYRDHWVLRCDTEEELQQWVAIMRELCPSCFKQKY